ncbi:tRNA uracil 4-sulfurtransferase ThiI [Clostridium magnum]|uniref:Probable tRNA sulfurtransferase n=1 Tax=Clostridium magnum DSM 2767 TaxID=1121326 RepID=A0A162SJW7_9CLOT|nr:tRNA uracil 4-sulfurtransferase ThiI [Clostridium magnum]KZL91374.1 putative tRNA sulfurtransferase [Clostridium magnum DSM 2767]SHH40023.1 thiamine biosynthesis protein ThiI [Clostridium magnum DSM 2767]
MKELLMVKYAPEIFLKGLNKGSFERKLKKNIEKVLADVKYELITDSGRWFIYSENLEKVVEKVKKVFGIAEVCVVSQIERDFNLICEEALRQISDSGYKTFKVETNRANKSFPGTSQEISSKLGAYILSNIENIQVDVHNPECILNVEIREDAYVYSKRNKAVGGMPYETNGSTLLLLSGGIDSPVAGYLMARRGVKINAVYFHSHPYTSERAKDKVKELARLLKEYTGSLRLFIVPFTDIQMEIIEKCPDDELTIIMRRFMAAIANNLAEKHKIQSLTTGESIGQVASQTMEGLVVSSDAASIPIFRPLIAMDKVDIMDIARQIGTYETSILPYEDCCTIFVPKHPKTKPILGLIKNSESKLDVEKLINDSVENAEIIDI